MRKPAIILAVICSVFLGFSEAKAASFTSVMSGSWHDPATWGGAGIPSIGDSATISAGHNVVIGVGGNFNGLTSNLTIQNTGTLSGTGNFSLRISGGTASIVNNGTISVATVSMPTAAGTYNLSGAGAWTSNQITLDFASVAQLSSNVNFAPATMIAATSATLDLNGFTMTFSGANFTNNGTLNIGSSTFNFNGTNTFTHTVGTITGTGNLTFAPGDGAAAIASDGNIAPSIEIVSGTMSGCFNATVSGVLTIDAGAVLQCDSGNMTLSNNFTVNGSLTRSVGSSGVNINFNGATLTNNGAVSAGFLVFNNSGAALSQTLAGTGSWSSGVSFAIGQGANLSPSNTALANDVTVSFDQFLIQQGSTLNLNGRTMTFGGNNFSVFGTLAVGGSTFNFNGLNQFSTQSNGLVTGSGVLKMSPGDGAANIFGRTQTKLEFVSGTMTQTQSVSVGGDFTIDAGATLTVNGFITNTFANVINNGNLNGNPISSFIVAGTNFANNGTISNVNFFFSPGACCPPLAPNVAQTISGAGAWNGSGTLNVAANSQVSLQNNLTYGAATLTVDGSLNTGAFVLTLPAGVNSNGNGDVIGNLKRTGLTVGTTVAFGNPNTTIRFDSGTPPTDLTVNLQLITPSGFPNAVTRAYAITPNGGSNYTATVRLHYLDSELNGNNEAGLQLWRRNGATWTAQGASSRDATNNWVETSGVTQFSPWAIAQSAPPTAANVSITGRVLTADGRSVYNARITMTDANGNTRTALTNPFGYFRFGNVPTGATYTFSANHKQHLFIPRVVTVTEEITAMILTAEFKTVGENL